MIPAIQQGIDASFLLQEIQLFKTLSPSHLSVEQNQMVRI